jgi:tetratricopeptide (TPR) repeat protein
LAKKLKREIKAATRVGEFIGYGEAPAWAARIEELIDSIEGVLVKGHGALVMELADLLREQLNNAFGAIDDSNGQLGMLVSRAMELHLAACRLACPDPIKLANDLFAREMADDFGLEDTIDSYADLLGDAGRQEMERLATAAWAKIRSPRADDDDDDAWSTHVQLAAMLDRFAADRGDLQARIDIRKRDLSHPGRYLDLAKLCEEHGRTDEAIRWVEDGLFIFEDNRDERFVLYAADLFMRHGRADDRSELLWRAFARSPSVDLHKKLVHNLKGDNRVQVTNRAIELIKTRKPDARRLYLQNDDDLVVSILSSERRLDEAWAFATSAKCTVYCLEELAQASEKSHPRQALEVHQRRVTRLVQTGGNQSYEEAHRLIKRMRIIAEQGGEAGGQATFESDLLAKHHAKRNFIKLMSGDTAPRRIRR